MSLVVYLIVRIDSKIIFDDIQFSLRLVSVNGALFSTIVYSNFRAYLQLGLAFSEILATEVTPYTSRPSCCVISVVFRPFNCV